MGATVQPPVAAPPAGRSVKVTVDSVEPGQKKLISKGPQGAGLNPSPFLEGPGVSIARDEPRVVPARAGEHSPIHQLLLAVFHGPSREEFHASLDDPVYEPTDRLIVKRGGKLLSHLHIVKRSVNFGSLRLPVAFVQWLGTLPEFRGQGWATRMLQAADQQMRDDGASLAMLRTRIPQFFHRHGWAVCGRHSRSEASARAILAQWSAQNGARRFRPLNIRLWRHVELPALMRIYRQNTENSFGPLDRSESYWRWLISRRAFGQIFVAIDGPDRLELDEATSPVVGYAVVRGRHVVELMAAPGHPSAAAQLLARACSETVEQGEQAMVLHGPPSEPLHALMQAAGGMLHHHEADQGEVFMVKLLDPPKFLRQLGPEIHQHAKQQRLPRPSELGLMAGAEKYHLAITRRGVKVSPDRLGRSYLAMSLCDLTRLLLGHLDIAQAVNDGRVDASTQVASQMARIIFPPLPCWRSPWDELAAS